MIAKAELADKLQGQMNKRTDSVYYRSRIMKAIKKLFQRLKKQL